MEKSKKKSDLLAAGRKKLEKFRQMKESKGGGRGKPLDKGTVVESQSVNQDPDAGVASEVLLVSNDGREMKVGAETSDLRAYGASPAFECTSEPIQEDKLVEKGGVVVHPIEGASGKSASCSQVSVEDASLWVSDDCRTNANVEMPDQEVLPRISDFPNVEESSQDNDQMHMDEEEAQPVVLTDTSGLQHVLGVGEDDGKVTYNKNRMMVNFAGSPPREETSKPGFLMDSMEDGHRPIDEFGTATVILEGVYHSEDMRFQGFQCEHPKDSDDKVVPDGEEPLVNLEKVQCEHPKDSDEKVVPDGEEPLVNLEKVHVEEDLILHDPNSRADCTGALVDVGVAQTAKKFHLEEEISSGSQDTEGLTDRKEDQSCSTASTSSYLVDQEAQVSGLDHNNSVHLNADLHAPSSLTREEKLQREANPSEMGDRKSDELLKEDQLPTDAALHLIQVKHVSLGGDADLQIDPENATAVLQGEDGSLEVEKDDSWRSSKENMVHGTASTQDKELKTGYIEQEISGHFGVPSSEFPDENLSPKASSELSAESLHLFHEKQDEFTKCIASESELSVKSISSLAEHSDTMSSNLFAAEDASVSSVLLRESVRNSNLADMSSEVIKELYVRSVMEDVLQVQLHEQTLIQFKSDEQDEQLLDKVSKLRSLLNATHGSSASITREFAQCRAELLAMITAKEELETQLLLAREKIAELDHTTIELQSKLELSQKKVGQELKDSYVGKEELHSQLCSSMERLEELSHHNKQLQSKLEMSDTEIGQLTLNLSKCKGTVVVLQAENENLAMDLLSARVELDMNKFELTQKKKTEDDLVNENSKIMAELHGHKERLVESFERQACLEDDMREAMLYIEQLTEQNLYLSCSLDIYLTKGAGDTPSSFGLCEGSGSTMQISAASSDDGVNLNHAQLENRAHCEGLISLKKHLEDAQKIMQRLDKSVQGMRSENAPLIRVSSRASSGVSKIIQAFESKALTEETLTDEVQSAQRSTAEDSLTKVDKRNVVSQAQDASFAACLKLSKEESCRLIAVMKQLDLDVEKVSQHFIEEQRSQAAALAALKDLQAKDVVQKQQKCNLEAKTIALLKSCEENMKKLLCYESLTSNLQYRLDELHHSFYITADSASAQVEGLQKELEEKMSLMELESNFIYAEIFNAVEKLRELNPPVSRMSDESNDFAVGIHLAMAVSAVSEAIDDLHERLLSSYVEGVVFCYSFQEHNEKLSVLLERNQSSVLLLCSTYSDIMKMLNVLCELEQPAKKDLEFEELLDVLPKSCETLATQLDNILNEQSLLHSAKVELESALLSRVQKIEDLTQNIHNGGTETQGSDKFDGLENVAEGSADVRSQFLEDSNLLVKQLLKSFEVEGLSAEMVIGMDKQPLEYIESLVYFVLGKYKETIEQLNLSRKCIWEFTSRQELLDDAGVVPLHVMLREEFELKSLSLRQLHERVHQLKSSKVQLEDEMHNLNEGLTKMETDLEKAYSELRSKDAELEQSEQRLASVKEKLSIAVAKGKGLIVQRDTLKQSLAEKTSDLENFWKELQSKSASLQELESKLRVYSEAGERIEALESELSYIRNSANMLRESFLQKDSVLQRIEEILEDLELPDHFNFGDVTEKIEWLVRSTAGNPVSVDWDQKSSVGEAGFMASDTWKEDPHMSLNTTVEDLRRKYEELENKFYGLAEQNDMLEQSLMERNNLVQRWEEVLGKIDMPLHLKSREPEYKIEWLRNSLWEAQHDRDAFRQKIESLVESSGAVMVDLEESANKISNLESALATVTHENELLLGRMEELSHERGQLLERPIQDELEKENSCKEIIMLQKKIDEQHVVAKEYHSVMVKEIETLKEKVHEQSIAHAEYCAVMEDEIKRLHEQNTVHAQHRAAMEDEIEILESSVNDVLLDHGIKGTFSGANHIKCLGECVKILLDNYTTLSLENSVLRENEMQNGSKQADRYVEQTTTDATEAVEEDNEALKSELEGALSSLSLLKKEQEQILEQHKSLVTEFQALAEQKAHLEEQLSQEEQKSASAREKLSVAVRKGKALVQQRDQLKQILEETNSEVERLKGEIQKQNSVVSEYEQKVEQLLRYQEKFETLDNENGVLRSHLQETENNLQSKIGILNALLTAIDAISVTAEASNVDPVKKMEWLVKLVHDLEAQKASYKEDARKSKQAAELLVSELNDVQDRFDDLQEELAQKENLIATISAERDAAEAAKAEALLRIEQSVKSIQEDRNNQQQKKMELKLGIEQLSEACYAFSNLLVDGSNKEVEVLGNFESSLVSLLKNVGLDEIVGFPILEVDSIVQKNELLDKEATSAYTEISEPRMKEHNEALDIFDLFEFLGDGLSTCMERITWMRERWMKQFSGFSHIMKRLIKIVENHERGTKSYIESLTSLKRYISDLEDREKEKDTQLCRMGKLIMLLYEACSSSILEIENHMHVTSGLGLDFGMHSLSTSVVHSFNTRTIQPPEYANRFSWSEESVKTMADTLLSTVKNTSKKWFEKAEETQEELKATVSRLQKEIQEKEVQSNRIYGELVSQIKEAEATANKYLMDLHSIKARECDLEGKVNELEHSQKVLLSQVNDLMAWEISSRELQKKVESLTDLLVRKDQEIEGLIQALDEEEVQMGEMAKKLAEMEKIIQQKNHAMESLEASRAKAVVKLSSTLRKFDELHHFSENLLSEIENFQVQLQGRDEEISFLRQEVTRYTNDLLTLQENNKKNSTEVHEISTWLDMMASRLGFPDKHHDDMKHQAIRGRMESLDAHISSIISELEGLRLAARNIDSVLQGERNKSEELQRKVEVLENSIREKDSQLLLSSGTMECGQLAGASTSEALEVESMIQRNKKMVTLSPIVPHARNIKKVANDHVAIDMESGSSMADDEDDDKGHLFKSLITSSFVPRITRPVADRIDGIWVSGGRVLMRQPTLRFGLVIYWIVIHVLLAAAII